MIIYVVDITGGEYEDFWSEYYLFTTREQAEKYIEYDLTVKIKQRYRGDVVLGISRTIREVEVPEHPEIVLANAS